MQRSDIIRLRLQLGDRATVIVKEPSMPEKSQSRVNPPELLPLTDFKGREEERLRLIYGIIQNKRPLTDDERKEVSKLLRSQNGEEAAAKRPDYDLKDFEAEFTP